MAPELQKRADRADQSVLFFLAGANFWEKHAKNRGKQAKTRENTRKQAKTGKKQPLFLCYFLGGKNWSVLIFMPFATMHITSKYFWGQSGALLQRGQGGKLPNAVTQKTYELAGTYFLPRKK